jgi:hypothetical protein
MGGISSLGKNLLGSQGGLGCVELVVFTSDELLMTVNVIAVVSVK